MEIRRLAPELAEAYVAFFDETPHDDGVDEAKCYCVCWCSDDYEGEDFSSREKRRAAAIEYVKAGSIQGYLAYRDGRIVGWCNANTKADCLRCCSWRRFMGAIPTEEPACKVNIKSVFCFTIAPDWKRKGAATQLLERVCLDASREGFDFVEAYPDREVADETKNFGGPLGLYRKSGFTVYGETEDKLVMRRALKSR